MDKINEEEYLDVVDENDNVIGRDLKQNKLEKGFISRTAVCFLSDYDGKLLIVKRSPTKKSFPNRYDLAVCGNVKFGETYEDAIKREMGEELGVACEVRLLEKIFNHFDENGKSLRYFTSVFLGKWGGDVHLNEELIELKKLSAAEIENLIKEDENLFTPGFVNDFNRLKSKLIQLSIYKFTTIVYKILRLNFSKTVTLWLSY